MSIASWFIEYSRLFRLPGLGYLSIVIVFGAISLVDVGVKLDLTMIA